MIFSPFRWFGLPPRPQDRLGCSALLLLVTAAYLVVGVAAFAGYSVTQNAAWVEYFFRIPGALLSCFLALVELWFCLRVLGHFSSEEPMHAVWLCIAGSAGFDLAGVLCSQVLAVDTPLNLLTYTSLWSPRIALMLREYGLLLGGTCRFTLLAAGLWLALRVYQRNDLIGRLRAVDWALWIAMGVYVAKEATEIFQALQRGRVFPAVEIAGWPVDLLLWLSLAQALLLRRSTRQMGPSWISGCWNAIAIGSLLICAGVVGEWATRWGYLPWPWSALLWYIWLPAGAAFALAPAYQLEAIQQAYAGPHAESW